MYSYGQCDKATVSRGYSFCCKTELNETEIIAIEGHLELPLTKPNGDCLSDLFNLVLQQLAAIMSSVKNLTRMSHIRFLLWDAIVQLRVGLGTRCCLPGRWCGGGSRSPFRYIVFSVLVCKLIVASQEAGV